MPTFLRTGFPFFLNAVLLSSWLARIPDVMTRLDTDTATLGLALFAAPVGSTIAIPFVGGLVERWSAGWVTMGSAVALVGSVALLGQANSIPMLAAVLFLFGLVNAGMEVGMNAVTDQVERACGEKIMSRSHGLWSIGYMTGALIAGLMAEGGVRYAIHLPLAAAVVLALILVSARLLPAHVFVAPPRVDGVKPPAFALPTRTTIGVCVMAVGVTLAEAAIYDWGTLHLRSDIGASPFWASFAYATFTLTMAIGRLGGDWVRHRVAAPTIIRWCAGLTAVGLVAFVASPSVPVATAALAVMGLGVSLVFPVAVSAAAGRGGPSAAANMAGLSLSVLAALMVAPPVIGIAAAGFGLGNALLLVLPLVILSGLLAGEAAPRPLATGLPAAPPAA